MIRGRGRVLRRGPDHLRPKRARGGLHPRTGLLGPRAGVRLTTDGASYPAWSGTAAVPAGTAFACKLVTAAPDGAVEWESGGERSASADSPGAGCAQAFTAEWR